MTDTPILGLIVRSYFEDHLKVQKGLRPGSIRSYRDALRLFLCFVAADAGHKLTRLSVSDLTFDRVLAFLKHLEERRGNHVRTRNQRLAILRSFFEYMGSRLPETLVTSQRVEAIPVKRTPPPETHFLDRDEILALFRELPKDGRHAIRDRALFVFLYNTGARVQEVSDLRFGHLDLGAQPRVQLHGKGDKWRGCPLWAETVCQLQLLLKERRSPADPEAPVFCSRPRVPLTRSGIYKIVRRHAARFDGSGPQGRRVSPHLFRHTAAVSLLEAGVEVNVIRGWLGHVSLQTTNRYAEITLRTKEAAMRLCEPHFETTEAPPRNTVWKNDESLLAWLNSL